MDATPTPDQTYCDVGRHQQCTGYTEDEADPESCMCPCHDEPEHRDTTMPTATALAETPLTQMPARFAEAIHAAMVADGYLERGTFNPFTGMDPAYAWLRQTYAQAALDQLAR